MWIIIGLTIGVCSLVVIAAGIWLTLGDHRVCSHDER